MTTKAKAPYPYLSINGECFTQEFLDDTWRELISKIPIWEAGIDVPSNTDKLAYIVLKQITMRMPDEPISEDV